MANKKTNKFAKINAEENTKVVENIETTSEVKDEAAVVAAETPAAAPAEKPAKKAAAKKETVKKEAKEAAEKPAAKKTVEKAANKVVVQFAGNEYDTADIVEKCKAAYKADNSRKQVRSIEVYIKPEDGKAYYVINGKAEGFSVDL